MNPCYGCIPPQRHVGCRTTCPDWKPYEEQKMQEYKQHSVNIEHSRMIVESIHAHKKSRGYIPGQF